MQRWTVTYGPEFAKSKKACKASPRRIAMHLAAIELHLERDPFAYSEPFLDESHRVIQTDDYINDSLHMTAYVRLLGGFVAEILWIEIGPLPADDDDDEDYE